MSGLSHMEGQHRRRTKLRTAMRKDNAVGALRPRRGAAPENHILDQESYGEAESVVELIPYMLESFSHGATIVLPNPNAEAPKRPGQKSVRLSVSVLRAACARSSHHQRQAEKEPQMSIIGVIAPAKDAGWIGAINRLVQAKARPGSVREAQHRQRSIGAPVCRPVAFGDPLSVCSNGNSPTECVRVRLDTPNLPEPLNRGLCYSDTTMVLERNLCSRALEPDQTMIVRRKTTRDA